MFGETFKKFTIDLNAAGDRADYRSGDAVTGRFSFDLQKTVKVNCIVIVVRGKVSVSWSTGGGKKRSRRVHSATVDFFQFRVVVTPHNPTGPSKLQSGTHVYPFTCQLPQGNFPSSFCGLHGKIVYSLTVAIDRPWHMAKEYVTEFNFVNPYGDQTELMSPMAGFNHMTLCCLWCISGPISMDVRLERKAFLPGEPVTIMCKFSNTSSRTATPKARLIQKQAFYTHNRTTQSKLQKLLASGAGTPVRAHSEATSQITIVIPPATVFTISNCSIIEVDYIIQVSLCVSGSPDLEVLFPIIITELPEYIARPPH